jgi:hypothetical protein
MVYGFLQGHSYGFVKRGEGAALDYWQNAFIKLEGPSTLILRLTSRTDIYIGDVNDLD